MRLVAAAIVLVGASVLAPSQSAAKYASYVIDAETGTVLHQINANTRNYPASLTKMMTLYMIFDALDNGKISLNTPLRVTARAARQPASKLGLQKGQWITFENAIPAIVVKSANDVAAAVSETLAKSERDFALSMTAMARKIGMSSTTFRNASGLPHRGQLSTARDMATLALRLQRDFPHHYHYFKEQTFRYKGLTYRSHNALLKSYPGADGMKTGYIRASGFNLVTSVERDGQRLIGVVFGGRSSRSRDKHMVKLLDKSYRKLGGTHSEVAVKAKKSKKARDRQIAKLKWGIQVGAYKTTEPAYKIAKIAVEKAPDYLFDGHIRVVPLDKGKRDPIYRARILGLTKRQAYRACRILKRRNINCMELRMKQPLQQLASAQ